MDNVVNKSDDERVGWVTDNEEGGGGGGGRGNDGGGAGGSGGVRNGYWKRLISIGHDQGKSDGCHVKLSGRLVEGGEDDRWRLDVRGDGTREILGFIGVGWRCGIVIFRRFISINCCCCSRFFFSGD